MNSRLIRTLIVVIGIAIGLTASYLLKNIDTDINSQRSSADALREQAAALSATIADVRAGQFAYVARGQGEAFWMSHVESLMPALQKQAAEFGASLASPAAQSAFEPATAALENFRTLDAKVREFVAERQLAARRRHDFLGRPRVDDNRLDAGDGGAQRRASAPQRRHRRASQPPARRARRRRGRDSAADGWSRVRWRSRQQVGRARSRRGAAHRARQIRSAAAKGEGGGDAEAPHHREALRRARARGREPGSCRTCSSARRKCSTRPASSSGSPSRRARRSFRRSLTATSDKVVARMGSIHRDANNAAAAAYRSSEVRTVAGDAFTNGADDRSADDERRLRRRAVGGNEGRAARKTRAPRRSPPSSPRSSRRSSPRLAAATRPKPPHRASCPPWGCHCLRTVTFLPQNQRFKAVFCGTPFGLLPVGVAPYHRNALQAGAGIAAFRDRSRCVLGPVCDRFRLEVSPVGGCL